MNERRQNQLLTRLLSKIYVYLCVGACVRVRQMSVYVRASA